MVPSTYTGKGIEIHDKSEKKIKMFEFLYIFYNLISGRYYKISWMDAGWYECREQLFRIGGGGSRGIFIFLI